MCTVCGCGEGEVRIEGKDYVMSDGDVVEFRHGITSANQGKK